MIHILKLLGNTQYIAIYHKLFISSNIYKYSYAMSLLLSHYPPLATSVPGGKVKTSPNHVVLAIAQITTVTASFHTS